MNLLEYDALMKRKQALDSRERLNAGIIAAAILNSAPFGDPDRAPVSPFDFVPELKKFADAHRAGDLSQMTPEQQKLYMMNMFFKRKVTKH